MIYSYEAKDGDGRTVTGSLDAQDERSAAGQVRAMGYFLMRLAPTGNGAVAHGNGNGASASLPPRPTAAPPNEGDFAWRKPPEMTLGRWLLVRVVYPVRSGVGLRDLALFYRQFSAMLNAGVPVYQCLTTLIQQTANPGLRRCIAAIGSRVQQGGNISAAMAEYPWIFTDFHRAMVSAGEASGQLDIMFARLATALEQEYALRNSIVREIWYPILVIHAAFLLPPLFLLVAKNDFRGYFYAAIRPLLIAYGLVIASYVFTRIASQFKQGYDAVIANLPPFAGTVRMVALARFCRALSSLYAAGIPLPRALRTAAEASGNAYLGGRMIRAIPQIEAGRGIVETLAETRVFPPMVISMLGTGETTGSLDQTMDKVAEYYEQESAVRLHQLCVTLGVIVLIIVAIMVAVSVIRFYTGYFNAALNDNG